jgi:septum formation inhibitor-activating ATPase MinD
VLGGGFGVGGLGLGVGIGFVMEASSSVVAWVDCDFGRRIVDLVGCEGKIDEGVV